MPQQKTLDRICDITAENGYPPTMKELASFFCISEQSAYARVKQLVKKGYLACDRKKARGLKVLNQYDKNSIQKVSIPILGSVSAGLPLLSHENVIGELIVDGELVRRGEYFALKITGNSMKNASINDGDTILVRRQHLAENGDIVIALVNGETTVKRLRITPDYIELVPENDGYKSIFVSVDDEFKILGKVIVI